MLLLFQYRKIVRLICVYDIYVFVYNYEDNRLNILFFFILYVVLVRDINISLRVIDNFVKM